ncbi:MAG TPA: CTP synthase, partial [Solirubrobacteraceae bacterium]|nr:CTP synthase [Solirubrobacteraceae bacterium]
ERLVEVVELPREVHPFYVASQYHPEFKSRPERPAPLFRDFVGAALAASGHEAGMPVVIEAAGEALESGVRRS